MYDTTFWPPRTGFEAGMLLEPFYAHHTMHFHILIHTQTPHLYHTGASIGLPRVVPRVLPCLFRQ